MPEEETNSSSRQLKNFGSFGCHVVYMHIYMHVARLCLLLWGVYGHSTEVRFAPQLPSPGGDNTDPKSCLTDGERVVTRQYRRGG